MSRRPLIFATLLLTCLTWSAASAAGQGLSVGTPAPPFKLPDLNGRVFKSSELKAGIVVLDLWATWCEPCVADIPIFNRLHEKFANRGVKIVGIAVQSGWANDIKPHVAKHSIKYTVLVGNEKTVEMFRMIGFPTTYLVGRDGKIVKKYIGTAPETEAQKEADLNHEIEMLVDGGSLREK
jgi:thiol-disulfide isomerase/thioredoxin